MQYLGASAQSLQVSRICKCKCTCLQSHIPVSSTDSQFTSLALTHSLIQSYLLWGEFSAFSASNAIHNSTIFIPPGTHYCWVGRGSMEWEVCPTLLHMANSGNRAPDLLILSPTPYPLGHMWQFISFHRWLMAVWFSVAQWLSGMKCFNHDLEVMSWTLAGSNLGA